ncbi:MAG: hypothetical protein KDC44_09860 [Phaeodactylibacter sp.]|nr:hypothetical protein [Phaeodactylibacter sp.]
MNRFELAACVCFADEMDPCRDVEDQNHRVANGSSGERRNEVAEKHQEYQ